jgi:hypothetical protein
MTTGETAERPDISPPTYGLGWFVDNYRGHARVAHGGNIDGFSAMVSLLPNDRIGMVVLANLNATPLPELLVRHTYDRLLGLSPLDWSGEGLARRAKGQEAEREAKAKKKTVRVPGTHPAHALADYAGDYENPGYGRLTVALVGDHLEVTYNGIVTPLEHWHYEVFNAAGATDDALEDTRFAFQTNMNGLVAAVAAPMEPAVKDIVFDKEPDARLFDPSYLRQFAGDYELAGQTVAIALQGSTLTVNIPGAPQFELVPELGGAFTFRQFSVVSLRFTFDAKGAVSGFSLSQPSGVFTATRAK